MCVISEIFKLKQAFFRIYYIKVNVFCIYIFGYFRHFVMHRIIIRYIIHRNICDRRCNKHKLYIIFLAQLGDFVYIFKLCIVRLPIRAVKSLKLVCFVKLAVRYDRIAIGIALCKIIFGAVCFCLRL